MMLYIGGSYQGKLSCALRENHIDEEEVFDAGRMEIEEIGNFRVLNGLHLLIERLLEEEISPEAILGEYLEKQPEAVIICDEVGCGVIPMEKKDREWREKTGRILCQLAGKAECVKEVLCGISREL